MKREPQIVAALTHGCPVADVANLTDMPVRLILALARRHRLLVGPDGIARTPEQLDALAGIEPEPGKTYRCADCGDVKHKKPRGRTPLRCPECKAIKNRQWVREHRERKRGHLRAVG